MAGAALFLQSYLSKCAEHRGALVVCLCSQGDSSPVEVPAALRDALTGGTGDDEEVPGPPSLAPPPPRGAGRLATAGRLGRGRSLFADVNPHAWGRLLFDGPADGASLGAKSPGLQSSVLRLGALLEALSPSGGGNPALPARARSLLDVEPGACGGAGSSAAPNASSGALASLAGSASGGGAPLLVSAQPPAVECLSADVGGDKVLVSMLVGAVSDLAEAAARTEVSGDQALHPSRCVLKHLLCVLKQ